MSKSEDTSECIKYDIDFAILADEDPEFAQYYEESSHSIDFENPSAVRQLTISILKSRYGILLDIPDDRLCPPVPNRVEYVEWIKQLVDSSHPGLDLRVRKDEPVMGLDIGVGSSCIYPLLAVATNPTWTFLGTEIDPTNLSNASKNVLKNRLSDRITLRQTTEKDPILCLDKFDDNLRDRVITFSMCNPPFFSSAEDMLSTWINKKQTPSAICTGAEVEMITEGGDLGFARRILFESLELKERVQWFTCMMGKKSSLSGMIEELRKLHINNFAVTCLHVSSKTRRWCIGWSFGSWRASQESTRSPLIDKSLVPPSSEIYIAGSDIVLDPQEIFQSMFATFPALWKWDPDSSSGLLLASGPVWSRAARRKRERNSESAEKLAEPVQELTSLSASFAVRITYGDPITIRWLKGETYDDFNSFCGIVRTGLRSRREFKRKA